MREIDITELKKKLLNSIELFSGDSYKKKFFGDKKTDNQEFTKVTATISDSLKELKKKLIAASKNSQAVFNYRNNDLYNEIIQSIKKIIKTKSEHYNHYYCTICNFLKKIGEQLDSLPNKLPLEQLPKDNLTFVLDEEPLRSKIASVDDQSNMENNKAEGSRLKINDNKVETVSLIAKEEEEQKFDPKLMNALKEEKSKEEKKVKRQEKAKEALEKLLEKIINNSTVGSNQRWQLAVFGGNRETKLLRKHSEKEKQKFVKLPKNVALVLNKIDSAKRREVSWTKALRQINIIIQGQKKGKTALDKKSCFPAKGREFRLFGRTRSTQQFYNEQAETLEKVCNSLKPLANLL